MRCERNTGGAVRRAARVDANQTEIVKALQAIGASVAPLSTVGSGMPDLLCGYRGVNLLLEVKDGDKVPSARKLTKDQETWHAAWKGQTAVVYSAEEAINVVTGRGA
jgi:hypothetical protein